MLRLRKDKKCFFQLINLSFITLQFSHRKRDLKAGFRWENLSALMSDLD